MNYSPRIKVTHKSYAIEIRELGTTFCLASVKLAVESWHDCCSLCVGFVFYGFVYIGGKGSLLLLRLDFTGVLLVFYRILP
ncbi:MAG: hypothetical protein LBQ66_09430 [Planctomycetaceae bacterium]|nr:hypothetical protein [Planctomycetaceae bacterium]